MTPEALKEEEGEQEGREDFRSSKSRSLGDRASRPRGEECNWRLLSHAGKTVGD